VQFHQQINLTPSSVGGDLMGQDLGREGVIKIHVSSETNGEGSFLLKQQYPIPFLKSISEKWISPVEKTDPA
jgi:hypothetical protein